MKLHLRGVTRASQLHSAILAPERKQLLRVARFKFQPSISTSTASIVHFFQVPRTRNCVEDNSQYHSWSWKGADHH